jgi:hypothetical protein
MSSSIGQYWYRRRPRRGIKHLRRGDVVRVFYTDPDEAVPVPEFIGWVGVVRGRTELPGARRRDPAYSVGFLGQNESFWWNELEVLRRGPRPPRLQLRFGFRKGGRDA